MIYILCFCLLIDVVWILYLYNKTENFIYNKDREIKELNQKHLAFQRHWEARKNPVVKKDARFNALKRKLGGV